MLVLSPNDAKKDIAVDVVGDSLLGIIKSQGVPVLIGAVQDLISCKNSHTQFVKRQSQRYLHTFFPSKPKVVAIDTAEDVATLVRYIASEPLAAISWRDSRAYMMTHSCSYGNGKLEMVGYLRGASALTANHLVHLTGWGDFSVESIDIITSNKAETMDNILNGQVTFERASTRTDAAQSLECLQDADELMEEVEEQRDAVRSTKDIMVFITSLWFKIVVCLGRCSTKRRFKF